MIRKGKKPSLNRNKSQKNALLRSLADSLIIHEKISTSQTKAKQLQAYIDRVIVKGKKSDNASRQLLQSLLYSKTAQKKVRVSLAKRYTDRPSGFTRIIKHQNQKGDNAPQVRIELIS